MYVILWEYETAPGKAEAFREAYGPEGLWARLFRRAEGFIGVELLSDPQGGSRFLTLDRWRSRADFDAFKADFGHPYEALDGELQDLTARETRLGGFEAAD